MTSFFKNFPRIAHTISNSSWLAASKTLFRLWYFTITRRYLKQTKAFPVNLIYEGRVITLYILNEIDIFALEQIYIELFLDKEYDWKPFDRVDSIIDLGAHFGDTSLYYNLLYPGAKIWAVEALPENIMRINFATRLVPTISVIEAAVGKENGISNFYLTPSTLGASLLKRQKAQSVIQVRVVTLEKIFEEAGIKEPVDLIKFDIEGGEFDLFSRINPAKYAKAYIGEIHLDFIEGSTLEGFCSAFSDFEITLLSVNQEIGKRYMFRAKMKNVV